MTVYKVTPKPAVIVIKPVIISGPSKTKEISPPKPIEYSGVLDPRNPITTDLRIGLSEWGLTFKQWDKALTDFADNTLNKSLYKPYGIESLDEILTTNQEDINIMRAKASIPGSLLKFQSHTIIIQITTTLAKIVGEKYAIDLSNTLYLHSAVFVAIRTLIARARLEKSLHSNIAKEEFSETNKLLKKLTYPFKMGFNVQKVF